VRPLFAAIASCRLSLQRTPDPSGAFFGDGAADHRAGHEAYMKLVDQSCATWQNRAQFVGIAASLMRRILVDHARGLQRNKRGGAAEHMLLDEGLVFSPTKSAALTALDDALEDLAKMDPRKAQVVELRYLD
jgi:RNA polymerase sigma factor (TIGR02999 family)